MHNVKLILKILDITILKKQNKIANISSVTNKFKSEFFWSIILKNNNTKHTEINLYHNNIYSN